MASRGQVQVDVVADTSKFAAEVKAKLEAIMKTIRLAPVPVDGDTSPLVRKARKAAADVDTSYAALFDKLKTRATVAGGGIGTALGIGLKVGLSTAVQPAVTAVIALLTSIAPAVVASLPAAAAALGTVKVALIGVSDAFKNIGDADKFNESLKTLSPNAQKFARSIQAILPDLKKVQQGVQDRFFLNFDKDVKAASKSLLGPLANGMNLTAVKLNKIIDGVAKFLAPSKGVGLVGNFFELTGVALAHVSDSFIPLLNRLADWVDKATDSGVNSAFEKAKTTLASLAATASNVSDAVGSIFGGLGKDGPAVAASLETASKAVRDFLASAQAQELLKTLGDTMDRVREIALKILADLPKLLPAVNGLAEGGFGVLLGAANALATALGFLSDKLGGQEGFFLRLGQALAVVVIGVKAYELAVTLVTAAQIAWNVVTAVGSGLMTAATAVYNTTRVAILLMSTGFTAAGVQASLLATAIWGQITALTSAIAGYIRVGAAAVASGAQQAAALAVATAGWVRLAVQQALATVRLVAYTVATNAVKVATIAWTAVQWLLNAALTANPIGIIILLIVALVAGLILAYKKSDTFRAIVDAAFRAVGAAAVWLWENAIKPLWDGILWGIGIVIAGFKLWWSFVIAVFTAVVDAALWLFNAWKSGFDLMISIVLGVADAIGDFVGMVVGFFTGLAASVGAKIGSLISFVTSIPGKVLGALGNLGNLLKQAGSNIIQGLIDGIDGMIGKLKDKVSGAVKAIRDYLPFSPAKVGPLSGSGSPERSGARIVGGIADGILGHRAELQQAMAVAMGGLSMSPAAPGVLARGGDGASSTEPGQTGGIRVWPSQPKPQVPVLTIVTDGTEHSQLLVKEISKAVRLRGGIVQNVLGDKNKGGVQ